MLNTVLLTNPIFLVVTAIAALVAGLIYAYNNCETFRNIVNTAFETVRTFVTNTLSTLRTTVINIWTAIYSRVSSVVWAMDLPRSARAASMSDRSAGGSRSQITCMISSSESGSRRSSPDIKTLLYNCSKIILQL